MLERADSLAVPEGNKKIGKGGVVRMLFLNANVIRVKRRERAGGKMWRELRGYCQAASEQARQTRRQEKVVRQAGSGFACCHGATDESDAPSFVWVEASPLTSQRWGARWILSQEQNVWRGSLFLAGHPYSHSQTSGIEHLVCHDRLPFSIPQATTQLRT